MLIRYEFDNGEVTTVEVYGVTEDYYLELMGRKKKEVSEVMSISLLEKRIGRKHSRVHKYTGLPVSYEAISENGEQIKYNTNDFSETELGIDLAQAFEYLTDIQRHCFIEVCFNGRTHRDVAAELRKSKSAVTQAIDGARRKLKKFFNSYVQERS